MHQVPSDLERETGFAHASRAGEGEQTHVWAQEQHVNRLHLVLTANERRERDKQDRGDELDVIIWRRLWKNDEVVLHIPSLPHVQAMVSMACCTSCFVP